MPAAQYDLGADHARGSCRGDQLDRAVETRHHNVGGLAIGSARTVQEGIAAAERYIAPSQNLTLADRTQIAMKTIGAVPARDADTKAKGACPAMAICRRTAGRGVSPMPTIPNL